MARMPTPPAPVLLSLLLCALPRAALVAGSPGGRAPAAPDAGLAASSRKTYSRGDGYRSGEDVLLQRSHKIEVVAASSEAPGVVSVALEGQGPEGRRNAVAELGLDSSPLSFRERLAAAGVPVQTLGALGHALIMGAVYALIHAAGPDHLGTLMTLSAAAGSPARAFKAGAAWGAGHCLGMVVLVVVFMGLGHFAQGRFAAWEHYGDYLIGASMIVCAAYFAATESKYVQQEADGTEVLRGCSCHGPRGHHAADKPVVLLGREHVCDMPMLPRGMPTHRAPKRGARAKGSINSLCTSSYSAEGRPCLDGPGSSVAPPAPPLLHKPRPKQDVAGLGVAGALLGVFQAACCPSGMIGISFILKLPAMDLVAFCASFAAISVLGTGLLALCWALLASTAACRSLSAKSLYRASCGLTLALGVAWIVATFYGVTLEFVHAE